MPKIDWYAIVFVLVVGLVIGYVLAKPGIFQVEVPLPEGPDSPDDDAAPDCSNCPLADFCDDSSSNDTPDCDDPDSDPSR